MPTPQSPTLAPILHFDPSHIADPPPPWVWRIIHELDMHSQVQIARVALDVHIAAAKAQVEGLQKIQEIVTASAKAR